MTRHSTRERLDEALARIDDPKGEGARACLTVYRDAACAAAEAADARAKAGVTLGALDGAIVSIKDLFDVAGEVTRAGSKVLAEDGKPAAFDAPVVRRLRQAGGPACLDRPAGGTGKHLLLHRPQPEPAEPCAVRRGFRCRAQDCRRAQD